MIGRPFMCGEMLNRFRSPDVSLDEVEGQVGSKEGVRDVLYHLVIAVFTVSPSVEFGAVPYLWTLVIPAA